MNRILLSLIFVVSIMTNLLFSGLRVQTIVGKAQCRDISKSKWEKVKVGTKLDQNYRIRVGKGSTVVLQSEDGTLITLKDLTIFDVSQLVSDNEKDVSRFRLYYGKLKAVVTKLKSKGSRWEVMTPTAVAGVRGTELGISVDNRIENDIAVFEGEVEVRNNRGIGKPVMVKTHQVVSVKHDAEPAEPSKLAPIEKTFEMWVKKQRPEKKDSGLPGAVFDMPEWLTPFKKNID